MLSVKGGKPLKGTIRAAGAKNAMTKLLVASLLSDKKCVFQELSILAILVQLLSFRLFTQVCYSDILLIIFACLGAKEFTLENVS